MRIEGISEGSATQLAGHAFEQHAPVRTAPILRAARPAQNDSLPQNPQNAQELAVDVVDVHQNSSESSDARQEVEFRAPVRSARSIGSDQKGVIDRNGDGMINLSDLPFDYFQIARQSSRKPIIQPSTDIPL